MKIKNPTNNALKVQIKGISYEVGANDSISNVQKEHAEYWKTLHAFIEVSEDTTGTPMVEKKEEIKEKIEEKVETTQPSESNKVVEEVKKTSKSKK